jgi:hypothetical protein
LVFLHRARSHDRRYQCGDYCKHHSKQQLQHEASLLAEAANATSLQLGAGAAAVLPGAAAIAAHISAAVTGVSVAEPAVLAAAAVAVGSDAAAPAQQGQLKRPVYDAAAPAQQEGGLQSAAVLQVAVAGLGCEPIRLGAHSSASHVVLSLGLKYCSTPAMWYE